MKQINALHSNTNFDVNNLTGILDLMQVPADGSADTELQLFSTALYQLDKSLDRFHERPCAVWALFSTMPSPTKCWARSGCVWKVGCLAQQISWRCYQTQQVPPGIWKCPSAGASSVLFGTSPIFSKWK